MRVGYKATKPDEIPESWCFIRLKDFLIEARLGGNYENAEDNNGIPVIKMGNLGRGKININKIQSIPENLEYDKEDVLENGDLLFNTRNTLDLVGKVSIWNNELPFAVYNSNIMRLKFDSKIIASNSFMNYMFNSIYGISSLRRIATGTTSVAAIYGRDLEKIKFLIPPLPEQQKIANILSTVDEKIEIIDAQITQTRELKKGLMQKLLTRGIGHTKFKDSVLGEIPEGWEVDLLDHRTKRVSGHTPNKAFANYYNGGIKWVSLADSSRLDKGWIHDTKIEISLDGVKNSSAVIHPKGTVLMSRDAGVGKSAVMGENMAVSQHFIAWICSNKLNNWFLYYWLQVKKEYFERIAVGSTIKTIGLPIFKKLQIPVPPISEQNKIAAILQTIDEKIDVLKSKSESYKELKKGLMQQLLTGKVRVFQPELEIA